MYISISIENDFNVSSWPTSICRWPPWWRFDLKAILNKDKTNFITSKLDGKTDGTKGSSMMSQLLKRFKVFLKKMGHSRPPFFFFFSSFHHNTVGSKQMFYKNLAMSGFEPWTSGIGSDRSANWATTTALKKDLKLPTEPILFGTLWYHIEQRWDR